MYTSGDAGWSGVQRDEGVGGGSYCAPISVLADEKRVMCASGDDGWS
jgi:hypothetical protein